MKYILVLIISLLLTSLVSGQEWTVKMDSVLKIIAQDDLFHGQILIAEQGKIVFHKAYGTIPNGNEITTSTPLEVKSITKAFTAAVILKLAQKGKLRLNDDVRTFVPNWPYKGITIRHLLSMTSGLPNFLTKAVQVGDTTKYMGNQEIINLIVNHPIDVKEPGEGYAYQNSNYITLAAIIENISGKSYTEYVTDQIIKPLELKHTYLQDLSSDAIPADADSFYAPYGDGNLHSTAADLYRFEQSLYGERLLFEPYIDSTFSKTKLGDGTLNKYGLGWWVLDDAPKKEFYILGDGPNIRASIQRYPDTRSTFIYVHNFSGRNWKDVYWVVRNIWNGEDYKMPVKIEIAGYEIDTSLYDKYEGRYLSKSFGLLHVILENNRLYVRPDPIPGKELLVPSSDTTFYFSYKSVEWEFFLNEDGSVKGFGFKGKPETMGIKQ